MLASGSSLLLHDLFSAWSCLSSLVHSKLLVSFIALNDNRTKWLKKLKLSNLSEFYMNKQLSMFWCTQLTHLDSSSTSHCPTKDEGEPPMYG